MKTIILKKTLSERLTTPWEPKEEELANDYSGQLLDFFESHNNDVEAALATIRAMIRFKEDNLKSNTVFERLIEVDKTEEIILRLFRGIFSQINEDKLQFFLGLLPGDRLGLRSFTQLRMVFSAYIFLSHAFVISSFNAISTIVIFGSSLQSLSAVSLHLFL